MGTKVKTLAEGPRPNEAAELMTVSYILMGLRLDAQAAKELYKEVTYMKESTTYQSILEEGRVEEAQSILALLGHKRFGPIKPGQRTMLDQVLDQKKLEDMCVSLLDARSWDEVLETR